MARKTTNRNSSGVTIKQVAQQANVSTATVSYVLNKKRLDRVSQSTREKVLKAARELNYIPNANARSLSTRRSSTIGVYIPRPLEYALQDACSAMLLRGIIEKCTLYDYAVQIAVEGFNPAQFTPDGWICVYASEPLTLFGGPRHLVFYVDPYFETSIMTLRPRHFVAGSMMGNYLRHSARKVACLLLRPEKYSSFGVKIRFRALRSCLDGFADLEWISPDQMSWDNTKCAKTVTEKLLQEKGKFDTVVVENDEYAAHVLKALQEAGVDVPGQIQVAAFNDTGYAQLCNPTITTVDLKTREVGYRAAHHLLAAIAARRSLEPQNFAGPPEPEMIIGKSTRLST